MQVYIVLNHLPNADNVQLLLRGVSAEGRDRAKDSCVRPRLLENIFTVASE